MHPGFLKTENIEALTENITIPSDQENWESEVPLVNGHLDEFSSLLRPESPSTKTQLLALHCVQKQKSEISVQKQALGSEQME